MSQLEREQQKRGEEECSQNWRKKKEETEVTNIFAVAATAFE